MKSRQVYMCPSDARPGRFYSYGYNYIYMTPWKNAPINSYGLITAVSLAEIQTPAETVMMTDNDAAPPYTSQDWVYSARFWRINGGGTTYTNSDAASVAYPYGDVAPRHLDIVNVLWADGHVKAQKIDSLKGPAGCGGAATCDVLWDLN